MLYIDKDRDKPCYSVCVTLRNCHMTLTKVKAQWVLDQPQT